ncbi:MAG: hypothetical protein ACD_21C00225G0004 [uncultured bacterium]|nr:MAG: hypothetical protein ACD_21C00225G0004 [uncultured bacterium]
MSSLIKGKSQKDILAALEAASKTLKVIPSQVVGAKENLEVTKVSKVPAKAIPVAELGKRTQPKPDVAKGVSTK